MSLTKKAMKRLDGRTFFWMGIVLVNCAIWAPMLFAEFPTIGLGHDSQVFSAAINASLREGNTLSHLMPKMISAREDIYSYPYFGILYPFYLTLGFDEQFSYATNLKLDFASVVFHLVTASVTFSVLLKRMGTSSSIAIIFGIFYAYSLHLKMWSSWIWAVSGYAWIPLCLLGIWEIVSNRNYRLGFASLVFGFGMITLGTALPLVYALILTSVFVVFCFLRQRPGLRDSIRMIGVIMTGGVVALAVGASHLLPTLHQSSLYIRWYSGGSTIGSFKPPYEGTLATTLDFSWGGLGEFLAPTEWFHGVGHVYVGASVLVFFFYYICTHWRNVYLLPIALAAVYFLFDAFGDASPVHRLTYQLPLISSVRYPLASTYVTTTLLLLFSGLGLSEFFRKRTKDNAAVMIGLFATATLVGTGYLLYKAGDLIGGFAQHPWWLLSLPAFAVAGLLIFRRTVYWRIALLTVFIAYLPQNSMLMHPKIPASNLLYLGCDDFVAIERDLRQTRMSITGGARLAVDPRVNFKANKTSCLSKQVFSNKHLQSLAMMSGWDVMQIYQSPRPIKEYRLFGQLSQSHIFKSHQRLLNAGISHVLRETKIEEGSKYLEFYRYIDQVGPLFLYQIKDYQLGFTTLGCLEYNDNLVVLRGDLGSRHLRESTVAYTSMPNAHCDIQAGGAKKIRLVAQKGSRLDYQLQQDDAGVLVTDQVFGGAWRGYLDGEEINAEMIDDYRLGFYIPKGEHDLVLSYQPRSFMVGVALTYLGLSVLFLCLIWPMLVNLSGRWLSTKSLGK